jgi:hypothetical protein
MARFAHLAGLASLRMVCIRQNINCAVRCRCGFACVPNAKEMAACREGPLLPGARPMALTDESPLMMTTSLTLAAVTPANEAEHPHLSAAKVGTRRRRPKTRSLAALGISCAGWRRGHGREARQGKNPTLCGRREGWGTRRGKSAEGFLAALRNFACRLPTQDSSLRAG